MMFRGKTRHLACVAALTALGAPAATAEAATINVPCAGGWSALVGAVHSAESTPVADTINLAARCTYVMEGLDSSDFGGNGFPVVRTPITIGGNGATITRATSEPFRFFYVDAPGRLVLRMLTLSGGQPSSGAAGGAIYVQSGATVELNASTISGNAAGAGADQSGAPGGDGGGVYNAGRLVLTRSTVSLNSAGTGGTGFNPEPAPEGPGNRGGPGGDGGDGGGIFNAGVLSASGGSVTNNAAGRGGRGGLGSAGGEGSFPGQEGERGRQGDGGGIFNAFQMTLTRVTLAGNDPSNCSGAGCPIG